MNMRPKVDEEDTRVRAHSTVARPAIASSRVLFQKRVSRHSKIIPQSSGGSFGSTKGTLSVIFGDNAGGVLRTALTSDTGPREAKPLSKDEEGSMNASEDISALISTRFCLMFCFPISDPRRTPELGPFCRNLIHSASSRHRSHQFSGYSYDNLSIGRNIGAEPIRQPDRGSARLWLGRCQKGVLFRGPR
jgi:hypothetical protein